MINYVEKIFNDDVVKRILPFCEKHRVYLVGGFLRDLVLNRQNFDKDLVFDGDDIEIFSKELANSLEASFVELDSENKIYRVVLKDKKNYIDIAKMVGHSISDDIKRRDFSVNSLVFDINNKKFIDEVGFFNDIKNSVLRENSEQNFIDDPLRILRAFRFMAEYGFSFSCGLENIIKIHKDLILKPAKERINHEFCKMFEGVFFIEAIEKMDELKILEILLPEFLEIKKVPKNSHHHLDLFHHLLQSTKFINEFYKNSEEKIKNHFETKDLGEFSRLLYLKIAAFFHDIGKPQTWTIDKNTGRHRFIKHDEVGAEKIVPILKRFNFSKKQTKYIQKIIRNHLYPSLIFNEGEATEKSRLKFFRKMENDVFDVIAIAYADRLSAKGEAISQKIIENNLHNLNSLVQEYLKNQDEIVNLPKLIDGYEVMKILNLKPSKILGQILAELKELQISGEIKTKEEALDFVLAYKISK